VDANRDATEAARCGRGVVLCGGGRGEDEAEGVHRDEAEGQACRPRRDRGERAL
jgi:hypothetical protein